MRRQLWAVLIFSYFGILTNVASALERTLRVNVVDAESGEPIAVRLYLKTDSGKWLYFSTDDAEGSAVRYEKQNWINKKSVEFHTTVSAHPCSAKVPSGKHVLTVERGKTYFPHFIGGIFHVL